MRDLNALDPLPKLGAKVERIEPLTEAEEKALATLAFECVPHNFAVADGRLQRVTEADCTQRRYRWLELNPGLFVADC